MKISSDKTRHKDWSSKLRNIRVKNLNVIIVTVNINSLALKFDGFKLAVSGFFDIHIITEAK